MSPSRRTTSLVVKQGATRVVSRIMRFVGATLSEANGEAVVTISGGGGGVPTTRTISTTAPLTGGGDLSADRTLAVSAATTTAQGVVELATDGETSAGVVVQGNDGRLSNSRAPTGAAGGDLGGTYPSPTVTQARGLRETGGPTTLTMGAVADGELLRRSGSSVVGAAIGTDVQAYDAGLTSLTAADASAGLPYVSAANTWASATYSGMLSVVSGAWKVVGLRESGGTDLTIGAISGSKLLGVASGSVGGVTVGTGLSLAAGTLAVDTSTIATQAWVGAGYQPLDSDLTAIAALGNGLPYRSGGVWSALSLASPLTASGGTLTVAQAGASTPGTVTLDQLDGGVAGVTATTDTGAGLLGTVDLDGTNTYSFLTLSGGNTYTVNATQVATFVDCTIRTGITLQLAGSPLRVVDLLKTEGTAAIRNDGANGAAGPGGAGAAGAAPAAINSRTTNNVYIGGYAGAPGHTLNSNGDNAQALSNSVWVGGGGGAGGSGVYLTTTRTGGGGGSSLTAQQWAPHFNGEFTQILLQGAVLGSAGRLQIAGGTGGGSGGAAIGSGGQGSAPGGGGGGVVVVCAGRGDFSSSTVISAAGGNAGTTATGGGTGNGGSGGSGGGGGGVILMKIGRVISVGLPSFDASGGNGANGAQIGGGRGDGGNGGSGGRAVVIVGGYAGSAPTIDVSGGAAGNGNGTGSVAGTAGTAGTSTFVAL